MSGTPAAVRKGYPPRALIGWVGLVTTLAAVAYISNAASGTRPDDLVYRYSTAAAAVVQYGLIGIVVLFLARGLPLRDVGFRRPPSWRAACGMTVVALVAILAISAALNPILRAGDEQGLVPESWDSSRAGAFIANFGVIVLVAPLIEETTYRGLGVVSIRARFGSASAVILTGLAFGLSHGLLVALPVLSIFGGLLAWLRLRTESLIPPIVCHAVFNATALLASVVY